MKKEASMDGAKAIERDQAALWKSTGGLGWVEAQDMLDGLLEPFEGMLLEDVHEGDKVLDVGCGTGRTTLAAARKAAPGGSATGVDISEPMIGGARARAEKEGTSALFVCADAQDYNFDPASFDRIISRFGIMFFADSVRAFAHLRHATRVGGALRVIAWRGKEENAFSTAAERAAAQHLPDFPVRQNDVPGQFGLASADRVRAILQQGGWEQVDIQPIDVPCAFPRLDLVRYLSLLGPVGRYLQQADDQTREDVLAWVLPAFDQYIHGDQVRFVAACWMVTARNPTQKS